MGIPEILGGSIGSLLNPWVLIGGFLVAKEYPATAKFWIKLICVMAICVLLSATFGLSFDGHLNLLNLVPTTSLVVVWATLIFLAVRRPAKPSEDSFDEEF